MFLLGIIFLIFVPIDKSPVIMMEAPVDGLDCKEVVIRNNPRKKSNPKKLKCLLSCLDSGKHKHMLNYCNEEKTEFEVWFLNKKSPRWRKKDISLFVEIDSASEEKQSQDKYAEKCKGRFKAYMLKVKQYVVEISSKKVNPVLTVKKYRILKRPPGYVPKMNYESRLAYTCEVQRTAQPNVVECQISRSECANSYVSAFDLNCMSSSSVNPFEKENNARVKEEPFTVLEEMSDMDVNDEVIASNAVASVQHETLNKESIFQDIMISDDLFYGSQNFEGNSFLVNLNYNTRNVSVNDTNIGVDKNLHVYGDSWIEESQINCFNGIGGSNERIGCTNGKFSFPMMQPDPAYNPDYWYSENKEDIKTGFSIYNMNKFLLDTVQPQSFETLEPNVFSLKTSVDPMLSNAAEPGSLDLNLNDNLDKDGSLDDWLTNYGPVASLQDYKF